jgi:pimeloyl-ACP methyl ester carboxylesterase
MVQRKIVPGTLEGKKLPVLCFGIVLILFLGSRVGGAQPKVCDKAPTGVETTDYMLNFITENMPDPQFNGRDAQIHVHRIKPEYANGKCPWVPNQAVIFVHGRSVPGSVSFDLRHPAPQFPGDPGGGELSLQEKLAMAGIDTFAPDLLGYGLSTRFEDGLDDPCNASLPGFNTDGSCPLKLEDDGTCSPDPGGGSKVCCDKTRNAQTFPLNQQTRFLGDGVLPNPLTTDGLGVNPLDGVKCEHSSRSYFANPDVWSRDLMQVIDDAIAKAEPLGHKVVLVGNSFGAPTAARTLYLLGDRAPSKVKRVVFLAPLFNRLPGVDLILPTEESGLSEAELSTSFPLSVSTLATPQSFGIAPAREQFCSGDLSTVKEDVRKQLLAIDPTGASWGGNVPGSGTGVLRFPTFTLYGLNHEVAAGITLPTLILHGVDDAMAPLINSNNLFDALTSVSNKVLVQVGCGGHFLQLLPCSGDHCDDQDPNTTPYGQDSQTWKGPYHTVAAALIEWVKQGTFSGAKCGYFVVNDSGIASEIETPNCPPP